MEVVTTFAKSAVATTLGVTASFLFVGSDPYTAIMFVTVIQSFYYLLFFNVNYPQSVLDVLSAFGVAKLGFIPNPLNWLVDDVPALGSPPNLFKNSYTGLFLNSAG